MSGSPLIAPSASSDETRVGFCGLGKMGLPMAQRLAAAGHRVAAWNRSRAKADGLAGAASSVTAFGTPAELAAHADIALLCLADYDAVAEVTFGANGLAQGYRSTAGAVAPIVVDHSTLAPSQTRLLAARWHDETGGTWIDAPVSGGTAGAANGTLAIMTGGDASVTERVQPYLAAYAARVTRMGDSGAGQATKLANQTIVMTTIAGIAEATRLAEHAGIDAARIPEALAGGWADSVLLRTLQPRMIEPPAQPSGSIRTMLKDLDAIEALARESGVQLPVASRVRDWLARAVETGHGDADISHIVRVT